MQPENTFEENRQKFTKLVQVLWRDFGPLVIGALVLIVVLVGGWSLFKKGSTSPQETVIEQTDSNVTLPESTINLAGSPQPIGGNGSTPSPSPSASPKQSPTPTPKIATETAQTKGGQLPQTGPRETAIVSLVAIAAGFLLFKKAHKLL